MTELWDDPNRQAVGLDPVGDRGGQPASRQASSDLDDMTKDELLAHAQSIGAKPANAAMTKDEIRESIDNA